MSIKRFFFSLCFFLLFLNMTGSGNAQTASEALFWYATHTNDLLNIYAYDPLTQQTRTILTISIDRDAIIDSTREMHPALSGDGHWLAYLTSGWTSNMHVVNLKTGQDRSVIPDMTTLDYMVVGDPLPTLEWSPDGQRLLVRGYEGFYVFEPKTESLRGIDMDNPFAPGHLLWTDEGNLFWVGITCTLGVGCITSATLIDIETASILAFYDSGNITTFPAWTMCELQLSPDKRYLAYMTDCDATSPNAEREVYVFDTLTDSLLSVTNFTAGTSFETLYFAHYDLKWIATNILLVGVAYSNALGEKAESYRYDITAQTLTPILDVYGQDWVLSPDGQQIAYRAMDNFEPDAANYAVRVANVQDLSTIAESSGVACNFKWSPNGDFLAFSVHQKSSTDNVCDYPVEQLEIMDAKTGQIVASIPATSDEISPLGWVNGNSPQSRVEVRKQLVGVPF